MDDLERVIKEKVEPMIEEAMQKFLGITVHELEDDITKRIGQEKLIGLSIHVDLPFKSAKRLFKKAFLERAIQTHYGNVSEVAELVGLNRRSVHRDIKALHVDVQKLREKLYKGGYFKKEAVDHLIRDALDHYKSVLRPEKLEKMYGHVRELSEHIAGVLPSQDMTWKRAELEFEKVYLKAVLGTGTLKEVAKKIGLRYETLLRKMKRFGIRN